MGHRTLEGSVQKKYWGKTRAIYVGEFSETHYLEIDKGGYCSKHCHQHKWNRFFLISGELRVIIYREHGEDVTTLKPGETTDVEPGVYHLFEATKDSTCLEVYWVDILNPDDILRLNTGGLNEDRNNNTL